MVGVYLMIAFGTFVNLNYTGSIMWATVRPFRVVLAALAWPGLLVSTFINLRKQSKKDEKDAPKT